MNRNSRMSDPAADSPSLLVSSLGAVRLLTLNRPASLNSFNGELHGRLSAALADAAGDSSVRALVITGAGRAFCAGQDLNDPELGMQGGTPDVGGVVEKLYKPLALRVRSMPMPVVAAVNGVAAGAGANLALGCDFVLAARSASFIQAFSKIALVPDCGGTWLLPRLLGRARALGLAMTGDKLAAEEAARIGLIWQCVEDSALREAALALATKLAAMPTRALVETRAAIDEAMGLDFAAALSMEAGRQHALGQAADAREGIAAFVEKRTPKFSDR
jgi:2-(1,2-epoxy-1,2-dihydrophenyl)acetyl-CoA isomerase